MKLEHYPKEKLAEEIKRIVGNYIDITKYKIFFFGSRVAENNASGSDIDVGIEGDAPIPIDVFLRIKEEISNLPILYHIDIIDFKMVDKNFYEVAKKNIEII